MSVNTMAAKRRSLFSCEPKCPGGYHLTPARRAIISMQSDGFDVRLLQPFRAPQGPSRMILPGHDSAVVCSTFDVVFHLDSLCPTAPARIQQKVQETK